LQYLPESINAHPVGHAVRLPLEVKMKEASFRACRRPIGSAIIVAKIRMKLATTKAVWSLPMDFEKLDAMIP
jgi:hypothetical protein